MKKSSKTYVNVCVGVFDTIIGFPLFSCIKKQQADYFLLAVPIAFCLYFEQSNYHVNLLIWQCTSCSCGCKYPCSSCVSRYLRHS